jgi:tetratricopeptide (TPR) repeat protein
MKSRFVIALGGIGATLAMTGAAQSAITVLGPGPSQLCYDGAENGGDPLLYIVDCNQALAGALSVSDRAATFINRGVLELSQNDHNAALADFNSGLAIDAGLGEGYVDRGAALIAQKQYGDAIRNIDKGLALGAKEPQIAYYDRAVADEAIGDIPAAYKDYQQALIAEPGFTRASDELKRFKVVRKPDGT